MTKSPLWRAIWIGAALFMLGLLLVQLRDVLTPVLFALLLSYMLDPLVDKLESWRVPRSLGIALILIGSLFAIVLFVILVVPTLIRDVTELARALSVGVVRFVVGIKPWLAENDVPVPETVSDALDQFGDRLVGMASTALAPVGDMLLAAVGGTVSALASLSNALFVPVFSFYFLHDFDRIVARVRELLPLSVRPGVTAMAKQVDDVLGQFMRGQLTVMGILAVLYGFGYWIIGVPLAVPIGVLAGVLSFIPYVGSTIALVFGLVMSALHFTGIGQLIGVVAVYTVVQVLESFVITPRIVGGSLGLSPVWVLFALLAFGHLFGFVGVMLALPASAVIKVFVLDALEYYQRSQLYLGSAATLAVEPRPARLRLRRSIRAQRLQRPGRTLR